MAVIRAAAVQLSPVLYSREGTVQRVVDKIDELGRQDVQFATFPETIVPYYPYFSFVQRPFEMRSEHLRLLDQAVTIPSPAIDAIGAAARSRATWWCPSGSTSATVDAVQHAVAVRRRRHFDSAPTQDHADLSRTDGLGTGRRQSGLRAVDSEVGRIGQLACFEHYNPLARYAMIADGEQIHSGMFPGSFGGELLREADRNQRP